MNVILFFLKLAICTELGALIYAWETVLALDFATTTFLNRKGTLHNTQSVLSFEINTKQTSKLLLDKLREEAKIAAEFINRLDKGAITEELEYLKNAIRDPHAEAILGKIYNSIYKKWTVNSFLILSLDEIEDFELVFFNEKKWLKSWTLQATKTIHHWDNYLELLKGDISIEERSKYYDLFYEKSNIFLSTVDEYQNMPASAQTLTDVFLLLKKEVDNEKDAFELIITEDDDDITLGYKKVELLEFGPDGIKNLKDIMNHFKIIEAQIISLANLHFEFEIENSESPETFLMENVVLLKYEYLQSLKFIRDQIFAPEESVKKPYMKNVYLFSKSLIKELFECYVLIFRELKLKSDYSIAKKTLRYLNVESNGSLDEIIDIFVEFLAGKTPLCLRSEESAKLCDTDLDFLEFSKEEIRDFKLKNVK